MDPLVSIVITYYNQTQFIRATIDSALSQTYSNTEVIVVNDGSTNDATSYLEKVKRNSRVVHQENSGVSAARNRGFKESKGAYLIFLDGDDLLKPDCVLSHVFALASRPDAGLIFSAQETIDEHGNVLNPYYVCAPRRNYFITFLECNPIRCPATAMFSRMAMDVVGGFDSLMQPAEDYDLSLRVSRRFPVRRHVAVACSYRNHIGGVSGQKDRMFRAASAVLDKARRNSNLSLRERYAIFWGYQRAKAQYLRQDSFMRTALLSYFRVRSLFQSSLVGLVREMFNNGKRDHVNAH